MIFETIRIGPLQVNAYILAEDLGRKAIIIDPGAEKNKIMKLLDKFSLKPGFIINTHGHIDHIACDDEFGVRIYAHRDDLPLLKHAELNLSSFLSQAFHVKSAIIPLEDKEILRLDTIELEVIHTPGHTPGGICLLMKRPCENILFSGDTLFRESIGRTDFAEASNEILLKSIREKLLVLPDETVVYPGHGSVSTIGYEKKNNPFLN